MPRIVHLPNGHNLSVTPVFAGISFKSVEHGTHPSPFPPGWSIVLDTQDHVDDGDDDDAADADREPTFHRFKRPSLRNDCFFISSISNSNDYKPAVSPTRQIAMMLWATLWWYFHQPEPDARLTNTHSAHTADDGKPRGEWRVNVKREGILKGKHLMPKLERMGLVVASDSSVGIDMNEKTSDAWSHMFVSRRHFWQLDARIYLFTLSPNPGSPYPSSSPQPSRSNSPTPHLIPPLSLSGPFAGTRPDHPQEPSTPPLGPARTPFNTTDPFQSTSHLPTYYPPPPSQYIFTDNIRHPLRPKPPRQGEVFYSRYIPSLGEYLSFRVASLSKRPVAHLGPVNNPSAFSPAVRNQMQITVSDPTVPPVSTMHSTMTDVEYLHEWMNDSRVSYSWGEQGPIAHQQAFLEAGMKKPNSIPVIGSFDGKPFGYFELYWVKEDRLGAYAGRSVGDWDRGIHCLVGEQSFRGGHRVRVWLSALVHYCWLQEARTEAVMLEPRVDNEKLKAYCEDVGFFKEREISFPHKQSNLMKVLREAWVAPCL